jgi:hypothetical protein
MDKDYLLLKRASASRPSGDWSDDDYDVLCNGAVVGRMKVHAAGRNALDARVLAPRRSLADARVCWDARGRHGSIRKKSAARVIVSADHNAFKCYRHVLQ